MENSNSQDTTVYESIRLSSFIFVPPSCLNILSNKIDNLIEISHLPEEAKIEDHHLPLLNPYTLYHRDRSFGSSIKRLVTKRLPVKEYVQGTKMNQCRLKATQKEQYVTLEVPTDLIHHWRRQGYTHIHFGAVRLCLTLHGRKGITDSTGVSLLNTSYTKHHDALINTTFTSSVLEQYPKYSLGV